jgi:hypothetical protein
LDFFFVARLGEYGNSAWTSDFVFQRTYSDNIEGITHKLGEVIMQTKIGGGTSGYFGELRNVELR